MPDTAQPLDKELQKDLNQLETEPYKDLVQQVAAEYSVAWDHQHPKKAEWLVRLKIYNNQKRDKDIVGNTLMFSILQTVLASLYDDKLMVAWGGREEGDEDVAENLNVLSEYDYEEMEKDILDYDWDWDTLFFGRGLLAFHEYIREPKKNIYLPMPEALDPLVCLRDPRGSSVNGDRQRRGASRFFGREVCMGKYKMMKHPSFFKDIDYTELKYGAGIKSLLQDAQEQRDNVQGRQYQKTGEVELKDNAEYALTEWYTHWFYNGNVKKVKVWLANDRSKIVGFQVLKNQNIFPIIDRPLYPTSHDWDGTSIPDLTEDKHRARAVAQNLAFRAMKADVEPSYIFDSNKITNRHEFDNAFNKFIPVDAPDANTLQPIRKASPNLSLLDFIYNSLDVSAQIATATPEIQQGAMAQQNRTLGEINLVASKVDTRYSLTAKVFGWSEKRFWRQWYQLYKDNFKEGIDEKIVRLVGAFGPQHRPLKREDIVTSNVDPDVKIESKMVSRSKQLEDRALLSQYFGLALQDPTSNRRWGLKKLGKLNGLTKEELDRLFPPTVDERIAEDENLKLNDNEIAQVLPEDDHNTHLEINNKAADTPAKKAHLETHKAALSIKKVKPELFPAEPQSANFQPPGTEKLKLPGTNQVQPVTPSQSSNAPTYGQATL